ncbi:hypothetical protein TFLX_06488 [Thermoflexales bacterium]|nr:hypothetical protein TFLX_06488 [Thermoflexales bacterium]
MITASLPQLVYVVRLWPTGPAEQPAWHASVQAPGTGERHIFADLETFFAFVEEQTHTAQEQSADDADFMLSATG